MSTCPRTLGALGKTANHRQGFAPQKAMCHVIKHRSAALKSKGLGTAVGLGSGQPARLVPIVLPGLLLFCDAAVAPGPGFEAEKVAAVYVVPESVSVGVGDSTILTAQVLNQDGTEIIRIITWSVQDTLIVDPIISTGQQVITRGKKSGSTWVGATVSTTRDSMKFVVRDSSSAPSPMVCDTLRSALLFYGNFEQPSAFAGWRLDEASGRSWSHTADTLHRECLGSARIELRKSDPLVAGNHRSEIKRGTGVANGSVPLPQGYSLPIGHLGSEVWWGWSVYIPPDWEFEPEYAPETIMQVAQGGRSPVFSLGIDGGNFYTETRFGYGAQGAASITTLVTSSTPITRGVWTDWVVHAKWSGGSDGVLQIWKNGIQIVNRTGPTAYSDWPPNPYPKWGIYKWSWSGTRSIVSTRSLNIDAVRVADGAQGSYAVVAPR